MEPILLGITKNNVSVYLTDESSHAKTHFAHHPRLENAVKEALHEVSVNEEMMRIQINHSEVVGTSDLIETTSADEIVYAIRTARTSYSRFVKNKKPIESNSFVIDVRRDRKNPHTYFLYTTYVGELVPSFPGGEYLPEQSVPFWSNHALVWGAQEIIPETITTKYPW